MSPPGRPKGEYRSAQREGLLIQLPGRRKGACRSAQHEPIPMATDYLQKILTAKVYDVAFESALDLAPTLTRRLGNRVLLKREDQQPVFSFKLRGAYNKMAHLTAAE